MRLAGRLLLSLSLAVTSASLVGCGDDGPPPPFDVRPSVEQLHITHAPPATELAVFDGSGAQVAIGTTDELGSLMVRKLAPGRGFTVKTTTATPALTAGPYEVMSIAGSQPAQSFYTKQPLVPGFQ